VDKGTGGGNTGLSGVEEEVLRVMRKSVLNIGIWENERRRFAA